MSHVSLCSWGIVCGLDFSPETMFFVVGFAVLGILVCAPWSSPRFGLVYWFGLEVRERSVS